MQEDEDDGKESLWLFGVWFTLLNQSGLLIKAFTGVKGGRNNIFQG